MKKIEKLIKWKVDPEPTGRYRSFERRAWPCAFYKSEREELCAAITCEDEYRPSHVKTGKHKELSLRVYSYEEGNCNRKTLVSIKTYKTIQEVKNALIRILENNKSIIPKYLLEE